MSGIVLNYKYKIVIYIFYNQKEKIFMSLLAVYKYKSNEMHVYVFKLYKDTVN